jgi:hypothetical protein
MPVMFPKRRTDGSFWVEITLLVNTNETEGLATRINTWLDQWVQANRHWNWFRATLDFFDDFASPPTCVQRKPESFALRLEGKPDSKKSWKDWIVLRLLKELQAESREITAVPPIVNAL